MGYALEMVQGILVFVWEGEQKNKYTLLELGKENHVSAKRQWPK